MIKKNIKKHKILIFVLLGFILTAYVWNMFLPKNTIVLAGEYIFSFDDIGHVSNILNDSRSIEASDYTNCFDCIDFYHYSRWYSLFKISYHALSQIVGLHPFIFLILSMITTQLVSLYIFVKIHFKKFEWFAFSIASFVFILYPYKYSLLVETHDGLLYSNMLLYLTMLLLLFKKRGSVTVKRTIFYALISGILLSFFLNINIAFFPIAFYMTLILMIVYIKSIWKNLFKNFLALPFLVIPSLIINFPFITSLFELGNSRHYEGYISFNATDSWLAGLYTANTNSKMIILFIFLFVFSFITARISFKLKALLSAVYVCIAIMILGTNSTINIYAWMFEHVPLLDSLRATYRYMFFELLIIFIFIYYSSLLSDRNKNFKIVLLCVSSLYLILPLIHIYLHRDYFFISRLPQEYFAAQRYVNTLSGDKMVFPHTTILFHNIATDYTWADNSYNKSILLYKNPFTSLLPLHNLIQFERFPYLLSPRYLELRYLTDLRNSQEDIYRAMELRGIRHLIIDKNFRWKENYPLFDLDHFISLGKIEKQFGNIIILQLPDKSSQCQKGYGKIQTDICTTIGNNVNLIGKSKEEYLLETDSRKVGNALSLRKNSIYTKSILDPQIYDVFIQNHIFFNKNIIQMFSNQNSIYNSVPLKKGNYILYNQVFTYSDKLNLMGNAKLVININGKAIKEIGVRQSKTGMHWENTQFSIKDNDSISIDIKDKGYIILGSAPILKKL